MWNPNAKEGMRDEETDWIRTAETSREKADADGFFGSASALGAVFYIHLPEQICLLRRHPGIRRGGRGPGQGDCRQIRGDTDGRKGAADAGRPGSEVRPPGAERHLSVPERHAVGSVGPLFRYVRELERAAGGRRVRGGGNPDRLCGRLDLCQQRYAEGLPLPVLRNPYHACAGLQRRVRRRGQSHSGQQIRQDEMRRRQGAGRNPGGASGHSRDGGLQYGGGISVVRQRGPGLQHPVRRADFNGGIYPIQPHLRRIARISDSAQLCGGGGHGGGGPCAFGGL